MADDQLALVMSPPCKSFSGCMPAQRAREARYVDMSQLATRGMFLALEAWAPARPKLLLLENVPRIQTRGVALLAQIVALLQASGYATDQRTHDCGDQGGRSRVRGLGRGPRRLRQGPRIRLARRPEVG